MVKVSEISCSHICFILLSWWLWQRTGPEFFNDPFFCLDILPFKSLSTVRFLNVKCHSWIFSSYYSSFQSRDPSEFILICCFGAQETFLISYLNIFVETEMHFFFQDSLIKLKRTAFIWKHVFTVTFYRLNAFLLKKSINFFCFKNQNKKHLSTQNFWMLVYF